MATKCKAPGTSACIALALTRAAAKERVCLAPRAPCAPVNTAPILAPPHTAACTQLCSHGVRHAVLLLGAGQPGRLRRAAHRRDRLPGLAGARAAAQDGAGRPRHLRSEPRQARRQRRGQDPQVRAQSIALADAARDAMRAMHTVAPPPAVRAGCCTAACSTWCGTGLSCWTRWSCSRETWPASRWCVGPAVRPAIRPPPGPRTPPSPSPPRSTRARTRRRRASRWRLRRAGAAAVRTAPPHRSRRRCSRWAPAPTAPRSTIPGTRWARTCAWAACRT